MTDRLAGMTDVDLVTMAQGWAESCRDEERASDAEDRFRHRFRAELLEVLTGRVAENQALRAEVRRLEAEHDRLRGAILRAAERYEVDGQPGDLGSVWGWRTIAEQLRGVAAGIVDTKERTP